ncbi:MAG: DNA polymerase III subunit gamma/tau, partial [Candidatus Omnitrophica bacterium]|nr:DNA polymerase III subunit gamma/tau [Candidatus Omnitrophota bacterium]
MSYLAFALKYRPKNFDEIVGQEHIVEPLKNAIINDRVHHAYLFSGPRGVGKTSLARILAKSLNCDKGPTVTPCGECLTCVEAAQGKSFDIVEIDGASNNGVDEIRVLRENVKLSTVHSRYKIYIIDEVHMLSNAAFNALLKTLEEPPSHVKFIFATTHPNKLLPTILSRCQKFQFNLVSLPKIVNKLKKIIDAENIKIEDTLLYTIGRASGGSIRDAESLLDQLVPVVLEDKSVKDIFSFLGIIDEESLNTMLKALIDKDFEFCLDFVDKIIKEGKDLGVFVDAFIEHLRNLLLSKVSIKTFKELSEVSPQSKEFILLISKKISTRDVLKVIDLFIEAKELSHKLSTIKIPLELALIKFTYNGNLDDGPVIKEKKTNEPEIVKEVLIEPEIKKNSSLDLDLEGIDFDSEEQVAKIETKNENKINDVNTEPLEDDDF